MMFFSKKFSLWALVKRITREKFVKALLLAFILNVLFGTAFYFIEKDMQEGLSWTDSIWWSMVTMTTVGYGDFFARTFTGRFFISYPCMLIGIGILGYLAGSIAEVVLDKVSKKRKGLVKIKDKGHIIICNCPSIEKILLLTLELRGTTRYSSARFVVLTDQLERIPEEFKEKHIQFVKGDPTREDILERAGIRECAGVFVLARDPKDATSDEKTFAVATIAGMIKKDLGLEFRVIVEMVSENNRKMMERTQVEGIISSEGISSCLMVQEFNYPGVYDIIRQVISSSGSEFYIFDTKLTGRKMQEVQIAVLKDPVEIQVIGILRAGSYIMNPGKDVVIEEGDKLIVLAEEYENFGLIEKAILEA